MNPTFLRANITTIIATFDAHEPGITSDGTHECPCGFSGPVQAWEQHLADKLALIGAESLQGAA